MKKAKLYLVPLLAFILVFGQFSHAFAAPSYDEADSISGTVVKITAETDSATGETTVWVVLRGADGVEQTVHLSQAVALEWHMLVYQDETLVPNAAALGWDIIIPTSLTIPDENAEPDDELMHPVASALAKYFSDIPGVDYDALMSAHEDGYGFGVIAQALWLTQKLDGGNDMLLAILEAKKSGDYSAFTLEDGTIPENWGQFRQAAMEKEKKLNLGTVMSSKDKEKDKGKPANPGNPGNNGNQGNNSNHGNTAAPGNGTDQGNNKDNGNKDNNGNGNPDKVPNKNKP